MQSYQNLNIYLYIIVDDNVKNIQLAANILKSVGMYNIFCY